MSPLISLLVIFIPWIVLWYISYRIIKKRTLSKVITVGGGFISSCVILAIVSLLILPFTSTDKNLNIKKEESKNLTAKQQDTDNIKQQDIKKKTQEIWQTAFKLLFQGKKMDALRNNAEMHQCMQNMQKLHSQVKNLQYQVSILPRSSNTFLLGIATNLLDLCTSCSINLAMEKCNEVEEYLGKVKF